MTFIYIPPEPSMRLHGKRGKQITPEAMDWYTPDQLLSEVERVRREVIEACAAENKRLRDALEGVMPWVVTQEFACHGMKCREPLCQSCSNDTGIACQKACDAYHSANTALKETKFTG